MQKIKVVPNRLVPCGSYALSVSNVEVVLKKICDDQLSEKIHSKAGALKNIILEIPLWPSIAENV